MISQVGSPNVDKIYWLMRQAFLEVGGNIVSWLSRGPDLSGEAWIGCKRLILKLSKVLLTMEVKGPYMYANRRLTLI
jgi:hypothetical protein